MCDTEFEFLDIVEQGCYNTDETIQMIVMLPDDCDVIVNKCISGGAGGVGFPRLPDDCEFAVWAYDPKSDEDDNYYENRRIFLAERRKRLDIRIKTYMPELYKKIKGSHNDGYEEWVVSYYQ